MAKLKDFPIMDFSGGLVCNKSDYEMDRNEMKTLLNFDIDERGKLKRRKGIQQWGTGAAGVLDNSVYWLYTNTASQHLLMDKAQNAGLWKLMSTYTTVAATTASTSLTVKNTTGFDAATSYIEVNGDVITYTNVPDSTHFTVTAATIVKDIPAYSPVNQWVAIDTTTGIDTRDGAYFGVVNSLLGLIGDSKATFDGTTITAIGDGDMPKSMYATVYRNRLYVVNADIPRQIHFSSAGDMTAWSATDYFTTEDDLGEKISGLIVNGDNLFIFKPNSIWTYNEVQLKQQLWRVGAYNNKCIQKIGELLYVFGPNGAFITNGFSAKEISKPVEKFINQFRAVVLTSIGYNKFPSNCITGQYKDKFIIYLGDIIHPDTNESLTSVALIYDIKSNNWTVHTDYGTTTYPFLTFSSFPTWGNGVLDSTTYPVQFSDALFAMDGNGVYWRLYDNKFTSAESTGILKGGDITANLISNNTGSTISAVCETPFYDLGNPSWWKSFNQLRVLIEKGDFDISYRLDKGTNFTDWISLGNFNQPNKLISLPDKKGYRISFKITSNTKDVLSTLNGLIIENIDAEQKQ
jgi:hypothetical protein